MNESEALDDLRAIKRSFQKFIRDNFESAAKDCGTCETFGVCCTDAHFVNVHITKIEAVAVAETLAAIGKLEIVRERAAQTIEQYNLTATGDTFGQTFACPLFEAGIGCLVHNSGAKPIPCIAHACYENEVDLPSECLQQRAEMRVEKLDREIYDAAETRWLPLPLWFVGTTE